MKKSTAAVLALLLMLSCFSGCGNKNKASSEESKMHEIMIPLKMPDVDISIPSSYEESSTDSNQTVYVKDDASVIINSDKFSDKYKNFDEYVAYALEAYSSYSDDIKFLRDEPVSINGVNGRIIEYIYTLNTNDGKFEKYCMSVFLDGTEQIYLITCKCDPEKNESYHDEFMDIAESFKLK